MSKNNALPDSAPNESTDSLEIAVSLEKPSVRSAIVDGKALIDSGKSKADAARTIFDLIKNESKEVIVAAFVEGATLTPKGALTYWYNCRRRASKEPSRKR
ncbi:hypothetical protein [Roseateles sp. PN1]|uniref:hypothetical protein n=1 Tax=Roseateles sp. PN1 TaxID=3137372 RepID=UPI003138A5AB